MSFISSQYPLSMTNGYALKILYLSQRENCLHKSLKNTVFKYKSPADKFGVELNKLNYRHKLSSMVGQIIRKYTIIKSTCQQERLQSS